MDMADFFQKLSRAISIEVRCSEPMILFTNFAIVFNKRKLIAGISDQSIFLLVQ